MPLSISNSDQRIPPCSYRRFWLVVVAGVLAAAGLLEVGLRGRGMLPSVSDSRELWARHRGQASSPSGKRRCVILGKSRAQFGLDPQVVAETWPDYEAVQLAVLGKEPLAALDDLADDPAFEGTIICSLEAESFMPEVVEGQSDWVDYYHHSAVERLNNRLNLDAKLWLQDHLCLLGPATNPRSALFNWYTQENPVRSHYIRTRPDRYNEGWFRERLNEEQLARARESLLTARRSEPFPELSGAELAATAQPRLRAAIAKLRARDSRLVLVRMPESGDFWNETRRRYRRADYWDVITAGLAELGVPVIHFEDYPQLNGYDCPEGSHLDAADAVEFTRRLLAIIDKEFELTNHDHD